LRSRWLVLAWVGAIGCAGSHREPQAPVAVPAQIERARRQASARCRDVVAAELATGRRLDPDCERDRVLATRSLVRDERIVFGLVDRRAADLVGVRLTLAEARRCRGWLVRGPGRDRVGEAEAERFGCRVVPYHGRVSITAIARNGQRVAGPALLAGRSGELEIDLAALDEELRAIAGNGLDGFERLELGRHGWAGSVDLSVLRRFRADYHLAWVRAGRGAPGLHAVLHPDHPRADIARALALEAQLARQQRDFAALGRGELTPAAFLDRHVWSPLRRAVEQMLAGDPRPPTVSIEDE
jgi:hypothetical protein